MGWLITVPVWGDAYHRLFRAATLPALEAALGSRDVRFIVHTDRPEAFADLPGHAEVSSIPETSDCYEMYGYANREALAMARPGEYVMLAGCDTIVSREFFRAAERRFAEDYRVIAASTARTLAPPERVPIGASSRNLLQWSFANRHPVTEGCFWGRGRNTIAWTIYFQGPNGIVGRSFHLPPFAVVADRPLHFAGTTVDIDLMECFKPHEIHVVTDPDECSLAEISDLSKEVLQGEPLCVDSVVKWAKDYATPMHRWLFERRIVLQGTGDDHLDEGPCNEILGQLCQ